MPTVKNLSAGEVIPQQGFTVNQNQNGGWETSREYYMLQETWETAAIQLRFARGQYVANADSSIPSLYSFLRVESKTAVYEDSGTCRVTVNYTGSASAQYGGEGGTSLTLEALPTYRLEGRLRELSITEHPKFKELADAEQVSLIGLMEGGYRWLPSAAGSYSTGLYYDNGDEGLSRVSDDFQITSDDGVLFASLVNKGLITYQSPTYVWVEITQGEKGMTPQQLNLLGQISTPRGSPPKAGGNRNWLLTSASQEQRGELYQTTLEWTLSEVEGWDQLIYTPVA